MCVYISPVFPIPPFFVTFLLSPLPHLLSLLPSSLFSMPISSFLPLSFPCRSPPLPPSFLPLSFQYPSPLTPLSSPLNIHLSPFPSPAMPHKSTLSFSLHFRLPFSTPSLSTSPFPDFGPHFFIQVDANVRRTFRTDMHATNKCIHKNAYVM